MIFIQHKNQQANAGQKAFTLIELLVVIAIIGILSSVVLASLNTARAKGRDARRVSDIKQIQLALELYADQNLGKYPTALSSVAPTYISTLPKDPSTNNDYFYAALGATSCTGYHIGGLLEQNNPVLTGDRDAAAAMYCPGSAADFNGTANCVATTGTDMCFDVANQ
ncbi:MAG: prepilin-type N-terminal cleavage/methylation domain-containing protein [bacterium]